MPQFVAETNELNRSMKEVFDIDEQGRPLRNAQGQQITKQVVDMHYSKMDILTIDGKKVGEAVVHLEFLTEEERKYFKTLFGEKVSISFG
jgi:hypothetical protein